MPDIIICAKGLTNGAVPMGAVIVRHEIHDAFMTGPEGTNRTVSRLYLLRPSAGLRRRPRHAGHLRAKRGLFAACRGAGALLGRRRAQPQGLPGVIDVRNLGLVAGIELEPAPGKATTRAFDAFLRCFWEEDVLIRTTGDIIALSPPLIIEKPQIERLIGAIAGVLKKI